MHRRMRELDLNGTELAEQLGMSQPNFSHKLTGRTPWTEPEMQHLLDLIGQPEETLADLFPRRKVQR